MSGTLDNEFWDRWKKIHKHLSVEKDALVTVEIEKRKLADLLGPRAKGDADLADLSKEESRLREEVARLEMQLKHVERAANERDYLNAQLFFDELAKERVAPPSRAPGMTLDTSAKRAQEENLVKAEERLAEQQAEQRADRVEEVVLKQVNGGEEKGLAETLLTLKEPIKAEVGTPPRNEQMPEVMNPQAPDPTGLMSAMLAAKLADLARTLVPGAMDAWKKLTEPDYLGKEEQKELQQLKKDHERDMDQLSKVHDKQEKDLDERLEQKQPDNADKLRDHLKQKQRAEKYKHTKEYVLEVHQVQETYENRRAEGQKQLDLEREHKMKDKEHDHEH